MGSRRQLRTQSEGDVMGLSDQTLSSTCIKNELEKWRLMNELHTLTCDEKQHNIDSRRELRKLRDDVTKMLAEGCVYKLHSFQKYDPFISSLNNDDDVFVENFKQDLQNKMCNTSPQSKNLKKSISSNTLPSISERGAINNSFSSTSNKKVRSNNSSETGRGLQSLPEINISPRIEEDKQLDLETRKYQNDEIANRLEDSFLQAPYSDDLNSEKTHSPSLFSSLAGSLHGIVLWRQKIRDKTAEKENYKEDNRVRYRKKVEEKPESKKFKNMFAGNCKTYYSMKKFVEKEAEVIINQVDSPLYQKKRAELEKLKRKWRIPEFIKREKTTSAIFRDFNSYKTMRLKEKTQKVDQWKTNEADSP